MIYKALSKAASKWWILWGIFFIYTALTAIIIQFILLPHIIPRAHLGHGLFVFDSNGFHQIAAKKITEMSAKGWAAWELRPNGHSPAGIASIFYYFLAPEPYALIPFNAAIHATAGYLVFFLLTTFIPNRQVAASGAALFIINPAALEWTTQIHKDGVFILGNLIMASMWLVLIRSAEKGRIRGFIAVPILAFIGALFIWMSRPYWNQVSIAAGAFIMVIIFFAWICGWIVKRKFRPYHVAALLLGGAVIYMQVPFVDMKFSLNREAEYLQSAQISQRKILLQARASQASARSASRKASGGAVPQASPGAVSQTSPEAVSEASPGAVSQTSPEAVSEASPGAVSQTSPEAVPEASPEEVSSPGSPEIADKQPVSEREEEVQETVVSADPGRPEVGDIKWVHNPYVPQIVDSRLYSLSFFRRVTGSQGGQTLLDRHVIFNSITDFTLYLPRAMQIGFLSPFPAFWVGKGSIPANTIGRTVLGVVMAFSYICFLFLILSFRSHWRSLEFWILIVFFTFGLLVFTYAYPNVGTLNRMRYGFFSALVAIGFAFALQKFLEKQKEGHLKESTVAGKAAPEKKTI